MMKTEKQPDGCAAETRVLERVEMPEKNCFVRSLEQLRASDIADSASLPKKRLTASSLTRVGAFLVCMAVFAFSRYQIVDRLVGQIQADLLMQQLQAAAVERAVPRMDPTQSSKPGYTLLQAINAGDDDPADTPIITTAYDTEYRRLMASIDINGDVYGWIRIKGTVIDYVIMQGADNDYYLKHTISGAYNEAGSIFADFRLSKTHRDNYNAIFYGHNMTDGSMFRALRNWYEDYATRDAAAETMEIEIITREGVYIYEPFAAYREVGAHFITASFADEKDYLAFLKEIQGKSVLRRRPSYDANSRICTLVTCTNAMEGERYVLHGILKSVVYYG